MIHLDCLLVRKCASSTTGYFQLRRIYHTATPLPVLLAVNRCRNSTTLSGRFSCATQAVSTSTLFEFCDFPATLTRNTTIPPPFRRANTPRRRFSGLRENVTQRHRCCQPLLIPWPEKVRPWSRQTQRPRGERAAFSGPATQREATLVESIRTAITL